MFRKSGLVSKENAEHWGAGGHRGKRYHEANDRAVELNRHYKAMYKRGARLGFNYDKDTGLHAASDEKMSKATLRHLRSQYTPNEIRQIQEIAHGHDFQVSAYKQSIESDYHSGKIEKEDYERKIHQIEAERPKHDLNSLLIREHKKFVDDGHWDNVQHTRAKTHQGSAEINFTIKPEEKGQ